MLFYAKWVSDVVEVQISDMHIFIIKYGNY